MKQREAGDTFRDCDGCPEMVVVPAGNFIMGSPEDEADRFTCEGPQHQVTICRPFALSKYEVTLRQFAAFVASTAYDAGVGWCDPGFKQSSAHPVVNISWDDVQAYISWLSSRTGQQYRLLSEAEWEYAARAGTTTRYHFGDTVSPSQANYLCDNKSFPEDEATFAVGSYSANKFGLHDVHGNVWEWVEDCWHDDYEGAPTDGSAWVSDCDLNDYRVVRGGCWYDFLPENLRSAYRFRFETRNRYIFIGFRVARTLEP